MTAIPINEIARVLENAYASTEYVALLNLPQIYPGHTVASVNTNDDSITLTNSFGFTNGSPLRMSAVDFLGGVPPAPTVNQGIYYAILTSGNTIKLAATAKDAASYTAIDLTSAGNDFSLVEVAPGSGSLEDAVRYELSAANGYQRFEGDLGEVTTTATEAAMAGYTATFAFSGTTTFNAILFITEYGSSQVGDASSGKLGHIELLPQAENVSNGVVYSRFVRVKGYPGP